MPQGHTNNPNGRPLGSRDRRTTKTFERLEGRGDKDPADFLSEIVSNENRTKRTSCPSCQLPHAVQIREAWNYANCTFHFPSNRSFPIFQSIDEAEQFLNSIAVRLGAGEIDSQSALETNTIVKASIIPSAPVKNINLNDGPGRWERASHSHRRRNGSDARYVHPDAHV